MQGTKVIVLSGETGLNVRGEAEDFKMSQTGKLLLFFLLKDIFH